MAILLKDALEETFVGCVRTPSHSATALSSRWTPRPSTGSRLHSGTTARRADSRRLGPNLYRAAWWKKVDGHPSRAPRRELVGAGRSKLQIFG